jgi:hypothetical protein
MLPTWRKKKSVSFSICSVGLPLSSTLLPSKKRLLVLPSQQNIPNKKVYFWSVVALFVRRYLMKHVIMCDDEFLYQALMSGDERTKSRVVIGRIEREATCNRVRPRVSVWQMRVNVFPWLVIYCSVGPTTRSFVPRCFSVLFGRFLSIFICFFFFFQILSNGNEIDYLYHAGPNGQSCLLGSFRASFYLAFFFLCPFFLWNLL